MSFTKPTSLGIIACPGGARFAAEIIYHLKKIYRKKFWKQTDLLVQRYGLSKQEVIREINLATDIRMSKVHKAAGVDGYRSPNFAIDARFTCFANGEFKTEILSSVRGMDLFIVQDVENHYPLCVNCSDESRSLSVNDHIFTLFVTIDAAQQAGANSITVVLPTYPYSRQHKKKGREGLTAARFGQMLEYLGVSRIITLDIHARDIENSFHHLRLENLHASYQILKKLGCMVDLKSDDLVVVAPDTGAVDRNKYYASSLTKPLAMIYKERDYSKVSKDAAESNISSMKLLGSVQGKTVFMADDLLGTGGTMLKAMSYIKDMGAKSIYCAVSLPFFTGNAVEHFDEAYKKGLFTRIIGTNAVHHEERLLGKEWYVSTNISSLFATTIARLHQNLGLSALLDNTKIIQKLLKKE